MNCENCGNEHDGSYGSGRFCRSECSRSFSGKRSIGVKRIIKKHENVKKICPSCNKEFEVEWRRRNQKTCSKSCGNILSGGWKKVNKTSAEWSEINKKSYREGKRVGGGLTKWYDYGDIKVQGTYELRTCQILDIWKEYNIIKDWEYTNDRIEYIGEDGKTHSYLLDFKVFTNEGLNYYIEVKGFQGPNDILKWKAVREAGNKLEVWFEKDIIKMEKERVV